MSTGTRPARSDADREGRHRRRRSFFAELPGLLLVAFLLALLLKTFLVQAFYIPSSSMEATLQVGDRVLVNKLVYDCSASRERGEVVVFSRRRARRAGAAGPAGAAAAALVASGLGLPTSGERDFIKRIIGLPGDVVEMRGGVVYVNGAELPEAPTHEGGYLTPGDDPTTTGRRWSRPGHYFMMGDNRANSSDSRFSQLGTIAREDVIGRAFVIVWPFGDAGGLPIPAYEPAPPATPPDGPAAPARSPPWGPRPGWAADVSAEDLERYETEMELKLYREYRDVLRMFTYVVETERRFYLANEVKVTPRTATAASPGSSSTSPTPGSGTCTARPASSARSAS